MTTTAYFFFVWKSKGYISTVWLILLWNKDDWWENIKNNVCILGSCRFRVLIFKQSLEVLHRTSSDTWPRECWGGRNGILGVTAFLFRCSFAHLHLNHTRAFPHLSAASFLQTWLPQAPSLIRTNSLCHQWKGYTYFLATSLFKWWLRDEMSWPVKTSKVLVNESELP